jgi:hypothetical protein
MESAFRRLFNAERPVRDVGPGVGPGAMGVAATAFNLNKVMKLWA